MKLSDLPHHEIAGLDGPNAPIAKESYFDSLEVIEGEVPKDLNGVYVRNGPNPRFAPDWRYHVYDGDGMLHAAYFDRGRVSYRNKWIRTAGLAEELAAGRSLWKGLKEPPRADRPDQPQKNNSNTDVKYHAGKLLTMFSLTGVPYHVDLMSLDTIGPATFDGAIKKLSAHSRPDEHTGELLFFDYGKEHPYMSYGVIGPDGKLKHHIPVELPGPRLPHDMAVTEHYTILHDFPLIPDPEALKLGRHKLTFHPEMPSRFGIVPRYGAASEIRWFEASALYMLHVANAWEEGDEIVMVGTPYRVHKDDFGQPDVKRLIGTIRKRQRDFLLYEWRFDLKTGETHERVIDDVLNSEFPVINNEYAGRKNRWSYHIIFPQGGDEEPRFTGLAKYDLTTGGYQAWSEGPAFYYNEPMFARADDMQAEDDGYLVTFVWNPNEVRSEIQIFDCRGREFGRGPIARVGLPQRVPNGFHATYVSRKRLESGL
ncbi:MAG: carotenoid oxygenase family protein [Burkholderiales bacterium]